MIIAGFLGAIARFILATADQRWHLYVTIFAILPLAQSLGIPVMTIAVKRYTNQETRSAAFGLFYSAMNVAALIAGPMTDVIMASFDSEIVALRTIMMVTCGVSVLEGVVACVVREIDVDAHGVVRPFVAGRANPQLSSDTNNTDDSTMTTMNSNGNSSQLKTVWVALKQKAL